MNIIDMKQQTRILDAYKAASNYPSPSSYTYVEE